MSISLVLKKVRCVAIIIAATVLASPAPAQPADSTNYPATIFAKGSMRASVSVGALTATIDHVRRPAAPDFETPVLTVTVDGRQVLDVDGVASGFGFSTAEARIAEIDAANAGPEVYFTAYSGGAHCCTEVLVATETASGWEAVTVGSFDGDGGYLRDVDGDGTAEIATYDNRFLYAFDCYACSTAPLAIFAVRDGEVVDVSTEPRFAAAHRAHLRELESFADLATRWSSPGHIAGWVAAKVRIGEGDEAWAELDANWNFAADEGEEACLAPADILEDCPASRRAVLSFPARLRLFLEQTGYTS